MSTQVFDVLIVGGGAVGVAVAREMTLLGKRCVICEKNVDVLSEASSGNTGHLARQVTVHQVLGKALVRSSCSVELRSIHEIKLNGNSRKNLIFF